MTLRISSAVPGPTARLKLDGRLTGAEVLEVRRARDEAKGRLALELTDLQFADRQGVSLLRELRAQGAQLMGLSHYLGLLLGETPSDGT